MTANLAKIIFFTNACIKNAGCYPNVQLQNKDDQLLSGMKLLWWLHCHEVASSVTGLNFSIKWLLERRLRREHKNSLGSERGHPLLLSSSILSTPLPHGRHLIFLIWPQRFCLSNFSWQPASHIYHSWHEKTGPWHLFWIWVYVCVRIVPFKPSQGMKKL